MENRLFLDINILQTVPASNINRDEMGAPKTCIYGGTTRARVSSQAQKKAVREEFKATLPSKDVGIRSKHLAHLMAEKILELQPDYGKENAENRAAAFTKDVLKFGNTKNQKSGLLETDSLFFISKKQIENIAKIALTYNYEGLKDKPKKDLIKKCTQESEPALNEYPTIDQILFGRMVASNTALNYEATCQVSHAISTHAVVTESDYFSAVDDYRPEGGSGFIGEFEFNSSTLYRYANINLAELYKTVGDDIYSVVQAFVRAFVLTMPSGKSNSFANRTVPDAVYIALRSDQPVNLSPAFEVPVVSENGYVEKSAKKLTKYVKETLVPFVEKPVFETTVGDCLEAIANPTTLKNAIENLNLAIENSLSEDY